MASKLTLIDISSGFKGTDVNTNFTSIEDEFDDTLSRSGKSPNQMEANIDMNSNLLRNLGVPTSNSDAARLKDLSEDNATSKAATAVTLEDTGGFYSSDNVEGALAEIGPDAEVVELGGDFDAGEEVRCEKMGNWVTITAIGILNHSSGSVINSTDGIIPSRFRPSDSIRDCVASQLTYVADMLVTSTGKVQFIYRDWSGSSSNQTSSGSVPSVTYLIT